MLRSSLLPLAAPRPRQEQAGVPGRRSRGVVHNPWRGRAGESITMARGAAHHRCRVQLSAEPPGKVRAVAYRCPAALPGNAYLALQTSLTGRYCWQTLWTHHPFIPLVSSKVPAVPACSGQTPGAGSSTSPGRADGKGKSRAHALAELSFSPAASVEGKQNMLTFRPQTPENCSSTGIKSLADARLCPSSPRAPHPFTGTSIPQITSSTAACRVTPRRTSEEVPAPPAHPRSGAGP